MFRMNIFFFFKIRLIYLESRGVKGKKREKEREKMRKKDHQREMSCLWFIDLVGLGWVRCSKEPGALYLGLPHARQGPRDLDHNSLFSQEHYQEVEWQGCTLSCWS